MHFGYRERAKERAKELQYLYSPATSSAGTDKKHCRRVKSRADTLFYKLLAQTGVLLSAYHYLVGPAAGASDDNPSRLRLSPKRKPVDGKILGTLFY